MDFSTLERLENNAMEIIDRLDFLKVSLLNDKSIDDYYEYASFVESLSQTMGDLEYRTNELEIIQDNLDSKEYVFVRSTVSSDKRAEVLIEEKFYETKKVLRHYAGLTKRLRTRYGGCTHLISALHDRFYFNSRVN